MRLYEVLHDSEICLIFFPPSFFPTCLFITISETSALGKACVKADDSFCQDVEFFVVGEADCLDCLDKMFTEDKTAGLGMMNDVAHVRIY